MSTSNCVAGRKHTCSADNRVIILSSSDEEDEIIVLSSDDDDDHKQEDDDGQAIMCIQSVEAQPQASANAASTIASLLAASTARGSPTLSPSGTQGVSRSWQPGSCRPNLNISPSPSPSPSPSSSVPSIMGHPPDEYRECREHPDYLLLTDSWLFKGIKANICDLYVSEIEHSDKRISSRRKIEVVTEYTWIQITEGQSMANVPFPAVYHPGQPRVWQGITTRSAPLDDSSEPPIIIDEHLQRQKAFPWEPTLKVIHTQQLAAPTSPAINFRNIDVVCDATTLATLFNFLDISDPTTRAPFRLELSTVRGTLFLAVVTRRGRGHTDKGNRTHNAIPSWVAPALTTLGTGGHATGPLFLSGNHFRVVRYRLGGLVLVVRTKVDFTLENRSPLPRTQEAPFRGCQYEQYRATDKNGTEQILGFQTLVKNKKGRGTRPDAAGVTSVRSPGWDCAVTLAAKMPLLWFGRVPFVLDGVVSRNFEVTEAKLFSARESYRSWEEQHQTGLRLMAGALAKLTRITRLADGNCVVIADPGQGCLRLCRPVIKRFPVPESLAKLVWGTDEEPAQRVYASSSESDDDSSLSQLSDTPPGFSDWTLEAARIPDVRVSCRARRTVDDWLKADDSEYESSEDGDPYCGTASKEKTFTWAGNPPPEYRLSGDPRRESPLGTSMEGELDGAIDQDGEEAEEYEEHDSEEDEEDLIDEDSAFADNMGDRDDEMGDGSLEQEDEDDEVEDDFMTDTSRYVPISASGLSSSQSGPFAEVVSDAQSSETLVADNEVDPEYLIPSVEVDEEELPSASELRRI